MSADLRCPVCATPLSETRFAEIKQKVRDEERVRYDALKADLQVASDRRLTAAVKAAEAKARTEAQAKEKAFGAEQARFAKEIAAVQAREAKQLAQHAAEVQKRVSDAERTLRAKLDQELSTIRLRDSQLQELVGKLQAREATVTAEKAAAIKKLTDAHAQQLDAVKQAALVEARKQSAQQVSAVEEQKKALAESVAGLESQLRIAKDETEKSLAAAIETKERLHSEELARQRAALDQAKAQEIGKIRLQVAEQQEALRKKLSEAEKKLEQKTAHELGHWPEVELAAALREAFPEDQIERVKSGEPGVDVIHTVRYKGAACGRIVIDSKNRQQWRESYVEKLSQDRANADAQHAILSTAVFPTGCRDLSLRSDVILAKPNQVVAIVDLLRRTLISGHIVGLSLADEGRKKDQLYKLITSELYRQYFRTAETVCAGLQQLDVDEVAAHQKVWERRGKMQRQVEKLLRDMNASISNVIEHPSELGPAEILRLVEDSRTEPVSEAGNVGRH